MRGQRVRPGRLMRPRVVRGRSGADRFSFPAGFGVFGFVQYFVAGRRVRGRGRFRDYRYRVGVGGRCVRRSCPMRVRIARGGCGAGRFVCSGVSRRGLGVSGSPGVARVGVAGFRAGWVRCGGPAPSAGLSDA